jgi:predicted signal transduction protein with EAL and GGDEF domain
LSYLKRFSVQRLKIDRSFVAEITEKHDTAAIVEAILSLARSLYIEVVAEGVESAGQRDFLASRGCALMQGYLFCAALSPTQMEAMLKGDGTAWQKEPPIQDDAAPSAIPPERRVPAAAPLTSVGAVTTLRPRSAHS